MVSEFQFINDIKSQYSLRHIGDDCAILPKDADTDLLLTADMLVEDIDFRLESTTPEMLGHRSLAVSLSDVAAMGGEPKWSMLSIAVPSDLWESGFVQRFYDGYMALAVEIPVSLVGGDISRSPDKVVIDSMVGGEVSKEKAVLRSGARPGDGIYVTGSLGGASGGLKLLEKGVNLPAESNQDTRELILKQLKPYPQTATAKLLSSLAIATSMIDISDGLSSDLRHICEMSSVGAEIDAELIPIDPLLPQHFPADQCLEMALNGGEDFQLLFTADKQRMSTTGLTGITRIGSIRGNTRSIELSGRGPLLPRGYQHF